MFSWSKWYGWNDRSSERGSARPVTKCFSFKFFNEMFFIYFFLRFLIVLRIYFCRGFSRNIFHGFHELFFIYFFTNCFSIIFFSRNVFHWGLSWNAYRWVVHEIISMKFFSRMYSLASFTKCFTEVLKELFHDALKII